MRLTRSLSATFGPAGKPLRPAWLATVGTGLYALFGVLWISYSSRVAAAMAGSIVDLQTIEIAKGFLFVAMTSLITFLVLLYLGRRVQQHQEQLLRQAHALAQAEQTVLAGTLAAAIAHDINNALTVASGASDLGTREDLVAAHRSIAQLSQRLMVLSSRAREEDEEFDVSAELEGFIQIARKQAIVRERDLRFEPPPPTFVWGSRVLFNRAALNLILNAAEATKPGGRIDVLLERDETELRLHVDDDGPGLSEEQLAQVFSPFYTTKIDGHGLGLLSLAACAQRHRGKATAGRSPRGGARFTLAIPLSGASLPGH